MLKVAMNDYSQFRTVGLGQRDDSIQQGFTQVSVTVSVQSNALPDGSVPTFDVFILADPADYECYIRSTVMLD